MWKCKKCGSEILANCYYDRGPIITGVSKAEEPDTNKIYRLDIDTNIFYCENEECRAESEILKDIAEWVD